MAWTILALAISSSAVQARTRAPALARARVMASSPSIRLAEQAVGRPDEFVAALADQKNFNSIRLAPYLVSQKELTRATQIDPELLLGGAQFDYQTLLIATVAVSSALALASMSADFLRQDIRFALTYGFALVPIAVLGIGSLAPGLLAAPAQLLTGKSGQAATRAAWHESAHLLLGYRCGLAVESFSVDKGREAVQFCGEATGSASGTLDMETGSRLLVVAMAGMIGEYLKFGDSDGGRQDLAQMQTVLMRISPRLSPAEQQGYTRWAALMAWSHLQSMKPELERAAESMERGAPLGEVLEVCEGVVAPQAKAN